MGCFLKNLKAISRKVGLLLNYKVYMKKVIVFFFFDLFYLYNYHLVGTPAT